MKGGLGKGAYG